MRNSKPWVPDDIAMLERLAGTLPPAEIGAILGRSKKAVQQRAVVDNLSLAISYTPPVSVTTADIRKAVELRDRHRSTAEAARAAGLTYWRLCYLLRLARKKKLALPLN